MREPLASRPDEKVLVGVVLRDLSSDAGGKWDCHRGQRERRRSKLAGGASDAKRANVFGVRFKLVP
ncbi:MAG TPA: hypothetical protein VER68_04520 [Azonexus sp.]|jgi:hypothetical protein|nr:hypothetical protein [Azonexus sp.]